MHVEFKNYLENTGAVTSPLLVSLCGISVCSKSTDAYLSFVLFYLPASLFLALLSTAWSI